MGNENRGLMRIVVISLHTQNTRKGVTRPLISKLPELYNPIVRGSLKREAVFKQLSKYRLIRPGARTCLNTS